MRLSKCFTNRIFPGLLTVLLVLSMTAGLSVTFAQTASDMDPNYEPEPVINTDDFDYTMGFDGTLIIAEYTGKDDVVMIPSEIDGCPVSEIGYQAFHNLRMKSLTIPEGVRTIGRSAFEYCVITDSISLPADILIQEDAFSYARFPAVVTIPAGEQLEKEAFSYCKGLEAVLLEAGATVRSHAFDYSKDLLYAICADGVKLEDSAFDYCRTLQEVILCGNVETEDEPVTNSSAAQIVYTGEEDFALLRENLHDAVESTDGSTKYVLDEMAFTTPSGMTMVNQPGYDLFLVDNTFENMVGAAVYQAPTLDFEKDESVEIMVKTAEAYVTVDAAYKVRICGYPAVWIDIRDKKDGSAGVYLYISLEDRMYFLMYVNTEGNREAFSGIVDTVTIGGQSEGTDLSAIRG